MSTPRRTNSRRAPKSPFTSPGADEGFGDNDDHAERMAARRAKAANERARNAASPFKSPGGGPKRSNSRVPPQRSNSRMPPSGGKNGGKLSEDAMMDIYNNCIKLSADNVRATLSSPRLARAPLQRAAQRSPPQLAGPHVAERDAVTPLRRHRKSVQRTHGASP